MTAPRRRRGTTTLLLLAVAALVSGCSSSIGFVANTVVEDGGTVVRVTTLAASGDAAYSDLMTRYTLLPGGVWTESVEEAPASSLAAVSRSYHRAYALEREFARGDDIPGDFARRGAGVGMSATNHIAVRARSYWFVDTYRYAETFRDTVSDQSLTEAVHELYALVVDTLADEIATATEGAVSADAAKSRLKSGFDERVEAFLGLIRHACFSTATDAGCVDTIEDSPELNVAKLLLDDHEALLAELIRLLPAPDSVAAEVWIARVDGGLYDAEQRLEQLVDSEIAARVEEKILGAHGFHLFQSFPFELSLRLPGTIVSTNATVQEAGLLRWEFESDDFLWAPRRLSAQSRVVHADRIAGGSVIGILVVIAGIFAAASKRKRAQRFATARRLTSSG